MLVVKINGKDIVCACLLFLPPISSAAVGVSLYSDCSRQDGVGAVVVNGGKQAVELHETLLPWSLSTPTLVFQGYRANADGRYSALKIGKAIADYYGRQPLAVGERKSGFVLFSSFIRDYEKERDSGDLLIFYKVSSAKDHMVVGDSGLILIPGGKGRTDQCPVVIPSSKAG